MNFQQFSLENRVAIVTGDGKGIGRAEEAIPIFQKAIRLNPFGPSVYFSGFGLALLNAGRYEEAVSACKKAVQLAPDNISANWNLASTYTLAGRAEEAIPLYQKITQFAPPGPWDLYNGFGNTLRDTGRFDEAVSAYKKAIQIAPDKFIPHVSLAATYSMMGREKEAHAEAEEVLRTNSKFSVDSWAKTLLYKDKSQKDKLITAVRKAGLK
jgi:tetratricopeptide (TPR) repeat protein